MTALPRPIASANFSRIESSLSNPDRPGIKYHDCFNNSSMTNLRDPVSNIDYIINYRLITVIKQLGICDQSVVKSELFSVAHLRDG